MGLESSDKEVLRAALAWRRAGERVTLITIARTWGSSPRAVGALAAVRGDGRLAGSVSGGCVEEDLIQRLCGQDPPLRPEIVTYGVGGQEAARFGLPCGGRLELVVEAVQDPGGLLAVLDTLEGRGLVARRLELDSGRVSLHPAGRDREFHYDGQVLEKVFGPAWRLLIVGANQLARYLAEMALALDYQVIVCDPRAEIRAAWEAPGAALDPRMPDDAVKALADDPRSAVVTVTHDPRIDDMALMEALDCGAFYIGALGSRLSTAKRRERLRQLEVSEAGLARLHGPVGLDIGSRTPAEIAVAILAEITAVRHGIRLQRVSGSPAGPVMARA